MKLIRSDYWVIAAVLMFMIAHGTTNFIIHQYQDVAASIGVAEEVAYMFEANPIAAWFLQLDAIKHIYTYVIMPAIIGGLYFIVRRRWYAGKEAREILEAFAITIFLLGLFDAWNDVTIMLGMII